MNDRYCSFCRTPKAQCSILIVGPEAAICGACITTCVQNVMDPPKPEKKPVVETRPTIVRP